MADEFRARHLAGVEFEIDQHPVEDFARMVDRKEIEVDAVRLHVAGVEREHAVIEPTGERDRNSGHALPPYQLSSTRRRGPITRFAEVASCRLDHRLDTAYGSPPSRVRQALNVIYACARNSGYKAPMTNPSTRQQFRTLLKPGAAVILPGVSNALAARVVADLGFSAAYITGAGIANTYLGIPDNGLVTLSELTDHVGTIREVFPGPLMVDADTGFGNAMNMVRTVKLLERAGADAIQIEDQVFPKRCGHFDGKQVIPSAEMVAKVNAAADARADRDLIIVARTDAIAVEGFEPAIERAHRYREAGADMTFIEAPKTPEQIAAIGKLPWPQIVNIVLGGRTPELPNERLKQLGFAGVLYANLALQASVRGMQLALDVLRKNGQVGDASTLAVDFSERQRLVGKEAFDALEQKYKV